MRRTGILVLAFLAAASPAQAQTAEPLGSAGAVAGGGQTWDDESNIGTGALVGGRVDWRVFGHTRLEASADVLWHDRSGGFFEAEGRSLILGASLVQRFGEAIAQPYLLGGLDVVRHDGSTTFDGVRTPRSSTGLGYHFGGGLAARVGQRLDVGPEARFYVMGGDDGSAPSWAYWVGVRFAVVR